MRTGIFDSRRGMVVALSALLLAATSVSADTIHENQTINTSTTWTAAGNDHIVIGSVSVASGATLTIAADCVVRFESGARLSVHGTLNAVGTAGHEVLFTRRDPDDEWRGLLYYWDSSGTLEHTIVEHATYSTGYAIYADSAMPTLDHCTIRNNDYGLYVSGVTAPTLSLPNTFQNNLLAAAYFGGGSAPSISNQTMTGHTGAQGAVYLINTGEFHLGTGNTFTGNSWALSMSANAYPDAATSGNIPLAGNTNNDGIRVDGGSITGTVLWRDVAAPFILTASPTISAAGTLAIDSDVEVRFENGQRISAHGTLDATGTAGHEVLFTRRDPTDEWRGLLYYWDSSGTLEHTILEHATYSTGYAIYADATMPTLDHCTIRNNDYGLYVDGVTAPTLSSPNTFQDNLLAAAYFYGGSAPNISNQTMTGHTGAQGAVYLINTGEFHLGTGNTFTGNSWALSMSANAYPDAATSGNIPLAGNTNNDGIRVDGGSITGTVLWRDVAAPFILTASPTISAAGTLAIDSDVEVRFENGQRISAHGVLDAAGTAGHEVLFTRRDPDDEWRGLIYYWDSSGTLEHTILEHATYSTGYAIYADATMPTLDHCTIRNNDYGLYVDGVTAPTLSSPNTFQDNLLAAAYFYGGSAPSVSNQTMTGHAGALGAVYMINTGEFHLGTGNTFTGNSWALSMSANAYPDAATSGNVPLAGNTNNDGIRVDGGSITGTVLWRDVAAPFILTASPTISAAGTLAIDSDVEVRFENGQRISAHGTLDATGTAGHEVLFTRRDPTDEWRGLVYYWDSSGTLEHTIVEHATYSTGYAVYAESTLPVLDHCTIRDNDYGLYVSGVAGATLSLPNTFQDNLLAAAYFSGGSAPSVSNQTMTGHAGALGAVYMINTGEFHLGTGNTFTGNSWALSMSANAYPDAATSGNVPLAGNINNDGIRVDGGSITGTVLWKDVAAPFIVTASPTISAAGTLAIESDVEVRFDSGQRISTHGTLDATGTAGHEILLTRRDPTDEWRGLVYYWDSSGTLEHTIVEHATYSTGYAIYSDGASPALAHCSIHDNDYGFYGSNASPSFLNCEITDNLIYGMYFTGNSLPTFGASLSQWNDIHSNGSGNADRDLCNGTQDIAAHYVYWGTIVESQIQARVHHEPDDSALGMVHWSPWTNADHDTTYTGTASAIGDLGPALPLAFGLDQNRPNPFGPSTQIRYALPRATRVRLDVFDVTGRRVETLIDGVEEAGFKTVHWDTRDVGSGVFFYRLQAGDFTETRKMVSLK